MASNGSVKAVSFDLWGTLIRGNKDFKDARNENIRTTWGIPLTTEDFNQVVTEACDIADEQMILDGNDLGYEFRTLKALERCGIDTNVQDKDALLADGLISQSHIAKDNLPKLYTPEVPKLIAELATKYPLIIISNTGMLPGTLMRELLDGLGLLKYFSVHIFSNEVNVSKPFPGIFESAFEGVSEITPGISKNQIVHIGDNKGADIVGGGKFGFQTRLVNVQNAASINQIIDQLL